MKSTCFRFAVLLMTMYKFMANKHVKKLENCRSQQFYVAPNTNSLEMIMYLENFSTDNLVKWKLKIKPNIDIVEI